MCFFSSSDKKRRYSSLHSDENLNPRHKRISRPPSSHSRYEPLHGQGIKRSPPRNVATKPRSSENDKPLRGTGAKRHDPASTRAKKPQMAEQRPPAPTPPQVAKNTRTDYRASDARRRSSDTRRHSVADPQPTRRTSSGARSTNRHSYPRPATPYHAATGYSPQQAQYSYPEAQQQMTESDTTAAAWAAYYASYAAPPASGYAPPKPAHAAVRDPSAVRYATSAALRGGDVGPARGLRRQPAYGHLRYSNGEWA
ncbi:hypothetical protein EJ06DRAFT_557478 [Trichodelitschia bisporula]|uniref:Uncharacterized protein n=1 Tax=Trichodelitschia bisporula TaxID=703511 RepID=A0A6G1HUW1_9PEZI|nr:hypothetical protein EJ06DRAFT_557478 [Trichodelitschia bisporula]